MESLSKLFGSLARVKVLRLFLFNHRDSFALDEVAARTKLSKEAAKAELGQLVGARVLRRAGVSYRVNTNFEHLDALTAFIRTTTAVKYEELLRLLRKAGSLRLVVLSGIFTGTSESPIDLLIVGDRLDDRSLAQTARKVEAELGREVRYASFTTEDFSYRLGIYDRLVRDVFDYPHQALLDRREL